MLFDYLTSQGRMVGEYKLLTTYPKRDVSVFNHVFLEFLSPSFDLPVNKLGPNTDLRTVEIVPTRTIDSRILVESLLIDLDEHIFLPLSLFVDGLFLQARCMARVSTCCSSAVVQLFLLVFLFFCSFEMIVILFLHSKEELSVKLEHIPNLIKKDRFWIHQGSRLGEGDVAG